jgi:hypothetical protein
VVTCLETLVEYFNVYAFTQVAIYGKTYCEAAKATWRLIKSRGLDAVINDSLIGTALTLIAFISALCTTGAGFGLMFVMDWEYYKNHWWWAYLIVGFLVSFAITTVVMEVVESGVAALFVCVAEEPQALAQNHPQHNAEMVAAIREAHPQQAQQIYGPMV